jgi:hypothetical protein
MATKPFDADTYIDAAAAAIDLSIAAEHRPGVILNFERIAAMADLIVGFPPLAEETASAAVFRP